jgi:hypothetical protein
VPLGVLRRISFLQLSRIQPAIKRRIMFSFNIGMLFFLIIEFISGNYAELIYEYKIKKSK